MKRRQRNAANSKHHRSNSTVVHAISRSPPTEKRRPQVGELLEHWYDLKLPRLRTGTAAGYRAALDLVLLPRFAEQDVPEIDADALADLIHALSTRGLNAIDPGRPVRPLSRATIDNYLKPLRGTLELARRRGRIDTNPFAELLPDERPKRRNDERPHEWTDAEIEGLLAASRTLARRLVAKYDYTLLLQFAATTGLRLGEILGLQWRDLDEHEQVLRVARQWTLFRTYGPPKTRAGFRRIALPDDLLGDLLRLRQRSSFSGAEDPIFASKRGTPLGHRNVTRRGFEPAARLAGLTDVSFHDLRHLAASRLISGGLDPVTVAHVLGHDNAAVTLGIYAHLFNGRQTDAAVRAALAARPAQPGKDDA